MREKFGFARVAPSARYACLLGILAFTVGLWESGCGSGASESSGEATLFLAGDGVLWAVGVDSGRVQTERLSELQGGDPPHRLLRVGDRLVFWGGATYVLDPARLKAPKRLFGQYGVFFGSAHSGRVWISTLPSGRRNGLGQVIEITTGGRVTTRRAGAPGTPFADTKDGLLVLTASGDVRLWDLTTKRTHLVLQRKDLGGLGPADGHLLASCTNRCQQLRLTDVRSGDVRRFQAPSGLSFDVAHGAFAPRGSVLAFPMLSGGATSSARLALVNVINRSVRVVAGSLVPGGYHFVAWSADSKDVFISGGGLLRHRVLVHYRRGMGRAVVMRAKVGDFYGMDAI
jgi:hypothetical protein